MKTRNGAIVALLVLATCSEDPRDSNSSSPATTIESSHHDLGAIPTTETAVWQKLGSSTTPDPRYLQAAAFDSARQVVVMFGGTNLNPNGATAAPNQETWEWSTTTGKWTNRTGAGSTPDARSGAAMVYDSKRAKFIMFGGRAGSGYNYEDTWEWDPATGVWTDVTNAGSHPSARSQHGMVYEASTGKILLFGGGLSDPSSSDATGVVVSRGETWELDPTNYTWTALAPATAPYGRHDFGLVWDSARSKAVLFGGLQIDAPGVTGIPKQDTWEWDPATVTWTERTGAGSKPGARYGHAMAFDGSRGKAVVFGGFDISSSSGGNLNDVWDWDPVSGAWTERMTGAETPMPAGRRYASLISDDSSARLELLAGATYYDPWGAGGTGGRPVLPPGAYGTTGSREVWELDPAKPAFTDRTVPLDIPQARVGQCMAYNPSTGNVYVFGGSDAMTGLLFDDLWAWDGKVWSQVAADTRPPARSDAAMAFDPARKSLVLFGGSTNYGTNSDTWEWTPAKGWTQLYPLNSPNSLSGHGMVTDTTRNKILLFGGYSYSYMDPFPKNPMSSDVWEWDGATLSWTDRGPSASNGLPSPRQYPLMAYDPGRQKLLVYDGTNFNSGMGVYWEWDPISAGWAMFDTGDRSESGYATATTYDSTRRRLVLYVQGYATNTGATNDETWELDANSQTLYVRSIATPPMRYNATMAFDSTRGVAVLFGGQLMNQGTVTNETWEYRVTGWGNGEGCTTAFASSCASGFCVDGVCCEAAACTGPCKSCNVRGSEGKCVLATAGTEVSGSCSNGQACDGSGNCKSGNGQTCASASGCASGFCSDGVCCDTACAGTCMACNQPGQVGKCAPFAAGTDPQKECGQGVGVCKSACDGVSGCGYPSTNVSCDTCMTCDGYGKCGLYDPYCWNYGGAGGSVYPYGGAGGSVYPYGGAGGYVYPYGGAGGSLVPTGGYTTARGGAGGTIMIPTGGSGGYSTPRGGSGGSLIPTGGYTYLYGGAGGSVVPRGGAIGGSGGRGNTYLVGGSAGFGVSGGTISRGGSIGFGGTPVGFGGVAGSPFASGGAIGQGGSTLAIGGAGGRVDGGLPTSTGGRRDAGSDTGIDEIRLHRSGCFCVLGRTEPSGTGLTIPLAISGLGLLLARSRRRQRR